MPVRAPRSVRALLDLRSGPGAPPAYIEGASGRTLSWSEVAGAVGAWDRLADQLASPRVGLAIADPLGTVAAFLAALAAGVVIAPLDPAASPAEFAAAAATLSLDAVVTDRTDHQLADALAAAGSSTWYAGDGNLRPVGSPVAPQGNPLAEDVALIMSSSGSTGTPKLIPLSADQLLHTAAGVGCHLELDADQRGYSPLPLWHINGLVVGVLATAVAGSSLVVDRKFSRRQFWPTVAAQGPTWLNLVPAMLHVLGGDDEGRTPPGHRVRLARSASAPLPAAVRQRFEDRFAIPIVETYGMTEAASQITANPLGARRPGSVGRPVGLQVRIVGADGTPVAAEVSGRVQIQGPNVTDVYWSPGGARRRARNDDGWLPTGDLGRLDGDGYLWLEGRDDDIINRGGEKVQPRQVEEVLAGDPRVALAVVVGRPDALLGQVPVAFVVLSDGADPAGVVADLEQRCCQQLSRFKRPAEITVVESMPAGPTGKPRRGELRRLAAATGAARP